ncbi:cysteine hydrolase family protein [Psychrobacter sp. LV10R520-6]|uniref:cysteine hydrolase family protein n=1 Tax=Psychrobacter sp. LV10R520-6 TaxID=1415574 RepID=UPI0024CC9575|nr:cysteine hydrolase family protein [Psychrobacter sp. LV10R520-6]SNT71153.1 Nicotinamidase-related amidase [Psychrobacter sp. LV10R520-6]
MSVPSTLLELAGGQSATIDWSNCAIVLIDFQNEYVDGAMPLGDAGSKATANARLLLDKARKESIPLFHIAHHGNEKIFDPSSSNVAIVDSLQPMNDEKTVTKTHPNAFHDTQLQELIKATGKQQIIFAGFMSHMCVSSSVRAAFDLGFENFVCHDACATRALPDAKGQAINADVVHNTAMAALQDRFATLVSTDKLVGK